jgi:hypothetical protein
LPDNGDISRINATAGVNVFTEVTKSDALKRLRRPSRDSEDSSNGYRGAFPTPLE